MRKNPNPSHRRRPHSLIRGLHTTAAHSTARSAQEVVTMPTDSQILNWLESQGVDFIGFINGSGLDVVNSPLGFRATVAEQMEEERNAQKVR